MDVSDILEDYPKTVRLKDGTQAVLRPLQASDEKILHEFFCALPDSERAFIKHRVTDVSVIRGWCQTIDYGRNLPLLALVNGKVAADGRLHQELGGWKRHIGCVSIAVHPDYRGKGLARSIVTELIDIAMNAGLEKLEAEFLAEQKAARYLFSTLGFSELLFLEGYVKDMQAMSHDYILMGMDTTTPEDLTHAGG